MAERDIASADTSNLANAETLYSVPAVDTDAATDQPETEYLNTNWSTQLGYYKKIPELKAAIDAKATWTIGKGFEANEITEMLLMRIKGIGIDSFNTILENMVRTYHIGGDAFAEKIRDKKGQLVNLKPLDPGSMKTIVNRKGLIIRYEQINKSKGNTSITKFTPDQIFHLTRNRTADEIHGESLIDAVVDIILSRNEAMADYRKLLHRNVFPVKVFKLDTDDPAEVAKFKAKQDKASVQGENMYIPMGTVEYEISAVPANATLNPIPWINQLTALFYQACNVPQIIVGGAQEFTEATAKIVYLAFEQNIKEEQLYMKEQVLSQLNLEIELIFPASLENELLAAKAKEETNQVSTPEDTEVKDVGVSEAKV